MARTLALTALDLNANAIADAGFDAYLRKKAGAKPAFCVRRS